MVKVLKEKKIVFISVAILACVLSLVTYFVMRNNSEVSKMTKIEVKEEKKEVDSEVKTPKLSDLVDDTEIPLLEGTYTLADVIDIPDVKAIALEVSNYEPTREDAVKQLKLDKLPIVLTGDDLVVEFGDSVLLTVEAFDNGKKDKLMSVGERGLKIGLSTFDKLLEESLIGSPLNQELEKEISYPDSYSNPYLAGKTIDYHITVYQIARVVDISEEDINAVYQAMIDNTGYSNQQKRITKIKQYLRDNATVKAYPASIVERLDKEYVSLTVGDVYRDEDDFLAKSRTNQEQYFFSKRNYIKQRVKDELLLEHLISLTGIDMNSDVFKESDNEYYTNDQKRELLFDLTLGVLL